MEAADSGSDVTVRPPVFLGCLGMVAALFALLVFGFVAIKFLESGVNTRSVLDDAASYGRGTYEFVPDHNIFVVRMVDGSFLALNDLDAANRANPAVRCRVQPIAANDPSYQSLLAKYERGFSPEAAGTKVIFRENCNEALYDITGVRLDAEGPNLDRHDVDVNGQGKLTVNTAVRRCTEHVGEQWFAPIECP